MALQNTHRAKEENIGEWKLKRKIDGKKEIVYTLPRDFVLRPGKSVRVSNFINIYLLALETYEAWYFNFMVSINKFKYNSHQLAARQLHV